MQSRLMSALARAVGRVVDHEVLIHAGWGADAAGGPDDAMHNAPIEESHACWERQGRIGIMMGKQFNANAYAFQMTNRFRGEWSTKMTVAGDPDSPPIIERVEYVIVDPAEASPA